MGRDENYKKVDNHLKPVCSASAVRPHRAVVAVLLGALVAACASIIPAPREAVKGHVATPTAAQPPSTSIPKPVTRLPPPPRPTAAPPGETYTVVVNGVPLRELLFALARDAAINVDIHPGIRGSVTLNAIDQSLPQILERLSRQVDLRYSLLDNLLVIEPDAPFLRTYTVDYVNLARTTAHTVSVSTQIATASGGGVAGGSGGDNNSSTTIDSTGTHAIWETLVTTISAMIGSANAAQSTAAPTATGSADQVSGDASGVAGADAGGQGEAAATDSAAPTVRAVIANPEAGLLTVRATAREHEQIQAYLDRVSASLQRQVLIEATVIEVTLNDNFQSGIDWSKLAQKAGVTLTQSLLGGNLNAAPFFLLQYADATAASSNSTVDLTFAARLLKAFGDIRIISSPKVMTLNNQTAVLKVVDNEVYFEVDVQNQTDANGNIITTVETTPRTVPVGFVMTVTPQINASDTVTLNVRPTISRILKTVRDPNPNLNAAIANNVPVISVREFESVMRTQSGQIAVLGGLMSDTVNKDTSGVPLLSELREVGELFKVRNNQFTKSELVVFIRPWVVRKPSVLAGDLLDYRRMLPENVGDATPQNAPVVKDKLK
ncbi:MAG: hypothetical protein HOI95_03390 [Chromatiales bacterium]|jgi:MSHA type pilus biogenesis protein MshL|nr:hypothetical protein [Chromatiales bacterium]